jgi:homoserine O-acetyltransferase
LTAPDETFELGDLELELGGTLPGARIVYRTHGTLSPSRDNAIVFPHMFSGTPASLEPLIAPGRSLDPRRWFVICPGQLGNGISSSPGNTAGEFPELTIGDDVAAQHRLVTERFGIERLALVTGFSMGAQQAYEWAVRFPGTVARLAPVAGTARTTPANALVVGLAEEALEESGLRLHAHVWAATALPPVLFRSEAWRESGFTSVDDLVRRLFEDDLAPLHPADLRCQLRKWRRADVSRHAGGDLAAALRRVEARTLVIAFAHDPLFPVADCEAEQRLIRGSELRVIDSAWGHYAWEMTAAARSELDRHLGELLGAG